VVGDDGPENVVLRVFIDPKKMSMSLLLTRKKVSVISEYLRVQDGPTL